MLKFQSLRGSVIVIVFYERLVELKSLKSYDDYRDLYLTNSDFFQIYARKMESKRFRYSENDMHKALLAVENGMSIYSAAKAFKVPRMTLSDKLRGKTPIIRKMGPPSILSSEEEMLLEKWILHLASVRFPVTKEQLLDSVQILSKQLGKQDKFPNGRTQLGKTGKSRGK